MSRHVRSQAAAGSRAATLAMMVSTAARTASALSALSALLLAGCVGGPPAPATTWLRLSTEAPSASIAASATAPTAAAAAAALPASPGAEAGAPIWQLVLPVALPGHLDRDTLFVPQGAAGTWVRPLGAARWVEPLRDAVPRVLREDLMRRLGGRMVWWTPLPPGVQPTHQLRVEFVAYEIAADGRNFLTEARWTIARVRSRVETAATTATAAAAASPPAASSGSPALPPPPSPSLSHPAPPAVHAARITTPVIAPAAAASADAEAWAFAHRLAIAELAARIAGTMVEAAR